MSNAVHPWRASAIGLFALVVGVAGCRRLPAEVPEDIPADPRLEEERLRAVGLISDDQALAEIVTSDASERVQREALGKIQSEEVLETLARLALPSDDVLVLGADQPAPFDFRAAALARLQTPERLGAVALAAHAPDIRVLALERVGDPGLLASVASDEKAPPAVRRAAVRKISDQARLVDRLDVDTSSAVRLAAVQNLHDQVVLAGVAQRDQAEVVRLAAGARVSHPHLLQRVQEAEAQRPVVRNLSWEMTREQVATAEGKSLGELTQGATGNELRLSNQRAFDVDDVDIIFHFDAKDLLVGVSFNSSRALESRVRLFVDEELPRGAPDTREALLGLVLAQAFASTTSELDELYGPGEVDDARPGVAMARWQRPTKGNVLHLVTRRDEVHESGTNYHFSQLVIFSHAPLCSAQLPSLCPEELSTQ